MAVVAAVIVASITWAACDVGTILANEGSGSGSGTDTGVDCPAPQATPSPAHTHTVGGTSNAGQACIVVGCHLDGSGGAPIFNYAGTVYNSTGTTGAAGINVLITLGGTTKKWLTDADGNFYVQDPLQAAPTLAAQANTKVCQTPTPMSGALSTGNGNCSAAGTCHGSGGGEGKILSQM